MNSKLAQSSRVVKLTKRFHDVLAGTVNIDPRGASLFLEGICAQDDPVVCLDAIVESAHGLSSVQSAMRYDLSTQFMNGLGATVLEYLLRACNVGGTTLDNVLFHVVDPPVFWSAFLSAFRQDTLSEPAQLVFARVLSRLLTLQAHDTSPYRDIASQPAILDKLAASSKHEIREMGHLIRHILSDKNLATALVVFSGPGGRHDNDSSHFRDIAILPTGDEIMCQKPPFLRNAFDEGPTTLETAVEDYLDNSFRMLREDMVFDIREEVKAALQKNGKHRGLRISRLSMIGVHTGDDDRKTRWGIKLQCGHDFWQLKAIEGMNARLQFLTRDPRGSRILKHQSPVCLVAGEGIISFGTINRVEELLAKNPPIIVLQLDGAINISKSITSLCGTKDIQLIQIDTATFSFEPVLSALQRMRTVPLSKEILCWNAGTPVESAHNTASLSHVTNAIASDYSVNIGRLLNLPKPVHLDQPQAKSMIGGLTQRVSLIQGPPGTGKSFIGALLAKAIHDKTSQTILVVCYTNHALDQFIGDLLKYDIPDDSIVRLGGRPNQATEHLALQKQPRPGFRYNWERIDGLKKKASTLEHRLQNDFNKILHINKSVVRHLKLHHREFFDAFYVPLVDDDGMIRVGQNGRAIDDGYLFDRWRGGKGAGVLKDEPHVRAAAHIWRMKFPARNQLLEEWRNQLIGDATKSISEVGQKQTETQEKIKLEFGQSTVEILRQKRIIACTTTGAAIYTDAIKKVGPKVLLVEEAGEILESHILTALPQQVERMILIGDHKQLRPKVNNYLLSVEKGEGYDLNRSLFERLVLKGYPHTTLSMQHRMRPDISTFVRELTYPELVDAPSTSNRSNIRGVASNVIFIDHTHPEDDESLIGDRLDGGATGSKQNTYEAEMVFKIVRYLGQQGYKTENIVVLTPYLGQLYKLRDALKRDNDPIINEMDATDLARAGLSALVPDQKVKKSGIKLATIDNYQGEESDIVVASLTRSNASNSIGFMDSPERLNVLLSRARDGLILIGNFQTFLHSKKGGALWGRLFTLLEKGQYIYQGFPVRCQRHPEHAIILKHANDFTDYCPDGGCMQSCGFILACGHACPMKCHPDRRHAPTDPHNVSQCKHEMNARCPADRHRIVWECRAERPSTCAACDKEAKRLEAIARKELEAQQKREEAEAEHRRRMAQLEAAKEAEEKRRLEEEEQKRQEEDRRKQEERRLQEEEFRRQDEEHRRQEEERRRQEEERRRQEEELRRQEEEHRRQEEDRRRQAEEAKKAEEERKHEEERLRKEEERRLHVEKLTRQAEEWRQQAEERRHEEERLRKEQERRLQVEKLTRQAEERRKHEERKHEEERLGTEEERRLQLENLTRQAEEWRKQAEERRREEERLRKEEERRLQVEKLTRQAEERGRQIEEGRRQEEILRKQEEGHQRLEEAHRKQEEQSRNLQEELWRPMFDQYRAQREQDLRQQLAEVKRVMDTRAEAERERRAQQEPSRCIVQ